VCADNHFKGIPIAVDGCPIQLVLIEIHWSI
jgi:hypothetical protein